MVKFIFNLDDVILSSSVLSIVAEKFGISEEIDKITAEAEQENMPFVESFIRRVYMINHLSIDEISAAICEAKLHDKVVDFIKANKDNCIIITYNIESWCKKLLDSIGCVYYCSGADECDGYVKKITHILKSERISELYKTSSDKVVYIGGSSSDMEGMRSSDISIACGLNHYPSGGILSIVNYSVFTEEALCRQLNQLL